MNFEQDAAITEISNVLSNYELGELVDLERNFRGYLNISYSIKMIQHGREYDYFLRRYRIGTKQREIEFEHAIINHLQENEFDLVAKVFPTKSGTTYLRQSLEENNDQEIFYAVFEFLQGEDKYTWVDPQCTQREIRNAATILASFHQTVADITPKGGRAEPRILDLLPHIRNNLENYRQKVIPTIFDEYLHKNLPALVENCESTLETLKILDESDCPSIVIHCDFHPGNLKFRGEEIIGLFDFDWSKIDFRCFDVALAGWYYFTSWRGNQDGVMNIAGFMNFLEEYQSSLQDQTLLKPMNELELAQLSWLTSAANLFVLNWTVVDYSAKDVDPEEYLMYLQHSVNFLNWFNAEGLEKISEQIPTG
jgi:homoserine kinase type II